MDGRCMLCIEHAIVKLAPDSHRLSVAARPGRPERVNFRPWLCKRCWRRLGLPAGVWVQYT